MALAAVAVVLGSVPVAAQQGVDSFVELLRSDLRTQVRAIVTDAMELSEAEEAAFWQVYREYETERAAIGDMRIALIKDYAKAFDAMTDETAEALMKRAFQIDDKKLSLEKKFYKKFAKATSSITAAKFSQVMRQVDLLVNLQIAAELPLVERTGE
jgi:hypothetical protein